MGFAFGGAVAAGLCGRDGGFDLAQPGVAVDHVFDRAAADRWRFLRYMGDAPLRRHADIAAVRMQFASQQRKQRRLAAAIGAD
ncbi:hypothetical protein D3C81_2073370 [compost metagenome]